MGRVFCYFKTGSKKVKQMDSARADTSDSPEIFDFLYGRPLDARRSYKFEWQRGLQPDNAPIGSKCCSGASV